MEQSMPNPTATQQEIKNELSREVGIDNAIEVKVDANGVAKLLGPVQSGEEEQEAVDAAKSVPGVTKVKDDLRVLPSYTP